MNEISVRNAPEQVIDGLPWLVFKLHNLTYTVNSRIVSAILQYPENVTPVASASESFRGIINFREGILPLLDLRSVFHMKSNQEDGNEFMDLVNQIKTEVDKYLESIKASVVSGDIIDFVFNTELPVATKWRYQSHRHASGENQSYENLPHILVDKINELESISGTIIKKAKADKNNGQKFEESLDYMSLKKVSIDIHKILSESINTYQESYKEMVVAVAKDDVSLGLIVDEVVAVEALDIVSDEERFPKFQKTNYFVGVAHSPRVEGEILLINEDLILNMSKEFDNNTQTE